LNGPRTRFIASTIPGAAVIHPRRSAASPNSLEKVRIATVLGVARASSSPLA
jgi:hypothetical protein